MMDKCSQRAFESPSGQIWSDGPGQGRLAETVPGGDFSCSMEGLLYPGSLSPDLWETLRPGSDWLLVSVVISATGKGVCHACTEPKVR